MKTTAETNSMQCDRARDLLEKSFYTTSWVGLCVAARGGTAGTSRQDVATTKPASGVSWSQATTIKIGSTARNEIAEGEDELLISGFPLWRTARPLSAFQATTSGLKMRLAKLVTGILSSALALIAQTSTTATDSSSSGSFPTGAPSRESRDVGTVVVGDEPTVVVLPAGQLQSQLLSSSGIQGDSPVEVYANYVEAQQQLSSLLPITAVAANTTMFVSVLVAPSLEGNLSHMGVADEPDTSEDLSARTQLYYNCTSAPNIWDLLDDTNVRALVNFTELSSTVTSGIFDKQNVSAVATILINDCNVLRNYSAEQIITGNAFFGEEFAAKERSFRVITSQVVDSASNLTNECLVRMEMALATLADLYPNCRIKFYTTDVDSIAKAADTQRRDHNNTARRLGASSFTFLKNSGCFYICGYFDGDEVDECRTLNNDKLSCTIQYYAAVEDCDNECGDNGLLPYQCLSKTGSFYVGSCGSGWLRPDYFSNCRRIISCVAITEASVSPAKKISWNLANSGAVVEPQIVLYESGDCSNPDDPRSNCCRIACENCYIDLKVLAMHVDVDVWATSLDTSLKVEGDASITVAIYAPNGCEITGDIKPLLPKIVLSLPMFMPGLNLDISGAVSRRLSYSLKPLGGVAKFGWRSILTSRAGLLDNEVFKDIQLTNTANRELKNAALQISSEYALISELGAAFSIASLGSVGLNLKWETYTKLVADVRFPVPFPALSTVAYNPNSLLKFGDCRYPHFMDIEGIVGLRNGVVTIPVSLIGYNMNLGTLNLNSPSPVSIISGCIATSYDAELMLVTAVNSVWRMDAAKRQKLIKILAWALGFPDIDTSSIAISNVFSNSGTIVIRLPVPPSVGDLYPDSSNLQAAMYERSRTSGFSNLVSTYVGLSVGGLCEGGWWGPSCNYKCSHPHCDSVSCNSVDGAAFSCGSCDDGYWGTMCESTCEDNHCSGTGIQCDQVNGDTLSCDACSTGNWGKDCQNTCYLPDHCSDVSCNQFDGTVSSCGSCDDGYWGDDCQSTCEDYHCTDTSIQCDQYDGDTLSCDACSIGFWGDDCQSTCEDSRCADSSIQCGQTNGDTLSCNACSTGYWGEYCQNTCYLPEHCNDVSYNQFDGTMSSCGSCEDGYWGFVCQSTCEDSHCTDSSIQCNQANGNTLSCDACNIGFWGEGCQSTCEDSHCTDSVIQCDQVNGDTLSCDACSTGNWGKDCQSTCEDNHCTDSVIQCDQVNGDTLSCDACSTGNWGKDCQSTCYLPVHCTSAICSHSSGSAESCLACESGYEGTLCSTKSFPLVPVVVGGVAALVIAVVVGIVIHYCRKRSSPQVIPT